MLGEPSANRYCRCNFGKNRRGISAKEDQLAKHQSIITPKPSCIMVHGSIIRLGKSFSEPPDRLVYLPNIWLVYPKTSQNLPVILRTVRIGRSGHVWGSLLPPILIRWPWMIWMCIGPLPKLWSGLASPDFRRFRKETLRTWSSHHGFGCKM